MSENSSENADYDIIIQEFMNVIKTTPLIQAINKTQPKDSHQEISEIKNSEIKRAYFIIYCIVLILGVTLNFNVIAFGCCKHKKLSKYAIWFMALAVTHLVSCVSVVFQLLYVHNNLEWNYGSASCKLSSYFTYGSMFSTASMLSLLSISSTLSDSACFKKSKNCNIILILFSWTIAAILACPSLFSREVRDKQCIDDYDLDKKSETSDGIQRLKTVVVIRFLTGVLVPALIMFLSWFVSSTRRKCKSRTKKQTEIICAIKIIYFVCWSPQIFFTMLQATVSNSLGSDMINYGLPVVTMLAMSHCFISPLFYLFLGCSIKMEWMTHDQNQDHQSGDGESFPLNN